MKREKERLYTILSEKTTLPVHYMSIMKDVHKEAIRGITYVGEKEGKDRWQSSTETWEKRTGDCEDIAIVIYRKLRNLGFPEWSTYVCIVKGYAFAIVRPHREATNFWILDNGKITISIKKAFDVLQYYDYTPLYVFNEKSMWNVFTKEIG